MKLTKEHTILAEVISEAWENPLFKQELIDSPVTAIHKLTGKTIEFPKGVDRIEVVDQTDSANVHINIPPKPNLEDVELGERELETPCRRCDRRWMHN